MPVSGLGQAFDASALTKFGAMSRKWSHLMSAKMAAEAAGAASDLLEASRGAIPKKTGQTASRLKVKLSHGMGVVRLEVTGDKVAMWLISGTRPHIIRPRRARALRFKTRSGETVFANEVHHPGTHGHDWRPRALGLVAPKIGARGLRIIRSLIVDIKAEAASL